LLKHKKFKINILNNLSLRIGAHPFAILEPYQNDLVPPTASTPHPLAYFVTIAKQVKNIFFAQYTPNDKG
jgi:hypothetical protein